MIKLSPAISNGKFISTLSIYTICSHSLCYLYCNYALVSIWHYLVIVRIVERID
jgi:hypothetical protein